jgi:GTP-binding protein
MINNKNIKRVVLIGRPNVGKSAIFNRLADTQRALVYDEAGVTRDPISDTSSWNGFQYEIIDTAGFMFGKDIKKESISEKAIFKSEQFIKSSDLILFVVDGDIGLVDDDWKLLSYSQKLKIPLIMVVNKSDKKNSEEIFLQIKGMSFEEVVYISAAHGKAIEDLKSEIIKKLFKNEENNITNNDFDNNSFKVAILGRPNVGKSSLINAITKEEKSIVSEIAGTTRETISTEFIFNNIKIIIQDTAGLRRPRAIEERLEELMVSNTIKTISNSDLIIMIFDISEEKLLDQDIKLVCYAFQNLYKGILIVWNKIDLIQNIDPKEKAKNLFSGYEFIFDLIPQIFVSAKKEKNIEEIQKNLISLWNRYSQRFDENEVFNILKTSLLKKPQIRCEQTLKIKSLKVIRTTPPTFLINVSNPSFFKESVLSFLRKCLRKEYNLDGVPIKWIIK